MDSFQETLRTLVTAEISNLSWNLAATPGGGRKKRRPRQDHRDELNSIKPGLAKELDKWKADLFLELTEPMYTSTKEAWWAWLRSLRGYVQFLAKEPEGTLKAANAIVSVYQQGVVVKGLACIADYLMFLNP